MTVVTLVHHRLRDFDAWKQVYDSVGEMQRPGGVREQAVMRAADDPGMVVVVHTFDDRATAERFFQENPDLRDAMGRAGVELDSFELELFEEVSRGRL
jgi:hypothetical protein